MVSIGGDGDDGGCACSGDEYFFSIVGCIVLIVVVGCCLLLFVVVGCCWLLLVVVG